MLQCSGLLLTPLLQRHRPTGRSSGCRRGTAPAAAAVQLLQALLETPACRLSLAGALGAAEAYPASPSPPGAGGGPTAMDTDDAVRHGTSMDAREAQQLAAALLDCLDLDADDAEAEEGVDGGGDASGGVGGDAGDGAGGAAGGVGRCTAAADGPYGSGVGGWGPYEVPRRVLALLAGCLEAGQEAMLAAMCHGGSWSGVSCPSSNGSGVTKRTHGPPWLHVRHYAGGTPRVAVAAHTVQLLFVLNTHPTHLDPAHTPHLASQLHSAASKTHQGPPFGFVHAHSHRLRPQPLTLPCPLVLPLGTNRCTHGCVSPGSLTTHNKALLCQLSYTRVAYANKCFMLQHGKV